MGQEFYLWWVLPRGHSFIIYLLIYVSMHLSTYLSTNLFMFLLKIFIYSLTIWYIYTVSLIISTTNSPLQLPSDLPPPPPTHCQTFWFTSQTGFESTVRIGPEFTMYPRLSSNPQLSSCLNRRSTEMRGTRPHALHLTFSSVPLLALATLPLILWLLPAMQLA